MAEFKSIRRRLIDAIRRSRARPSESSTAEPFAVPDDMMKRETTGAAIDALHLKLKFIVGGIPEEHEWKSWVKGFGDADHRMLDIVKDETPVRRSSATTNLTSGEIFAVRSVSDTRGRRSRGRRAALVPV
ncbi:hypothetical protein [Paraburkholderia fungorum]|uniref:hypothetical protein n=1 Tax=Paraburkholderia fungorum TaxID=134537 RepID=UPI0038B9469D